MKKMTEFKETKLGSGPIFLALKENIGIILGFLFVFIILSFATDKFLTRSNMSNVIRQVTMNMFLSCGLCIVIIYGAIDLSVGSVLGITACFCAGFMDRFGLPWYIAMICAMFFGVLFGAFSGLLVSRTTIPPFIITLAMMNIGRGVCRVYTNAKTIVISDQNYIFLGTGSVYGIPIQVLWMAAALLLTAFILKRTILGRHIYAVGGNHQAAIYSGINVKMVGLFVFMYSSFMASLAGIYTSARTFAALYTTGMGEELNAISAVVLGGISMSGGVGGILGVMFGVLLIGIINNGLNLLGIDSSWQYIIQGIVILFAVYFDYIRKRKMD